VPDPDDDLRQTALDQASALHRDADDLAALLRSMTDIRIGMTVDTVGMGELSAYELAEAEAARLLSWAGLVEVRLDANEPETAPSGAIQVGVLVGVTTLEPDAAVRSACAALADRRWSAPRQGLMAAHRFAVWSADPPVAAGPVRIELHAAPGLALLTERQRREMLDDPDHAHLHDVLRRSLR
jgi:hypothetical protein